jgi:hypothetical protein
MEPHPHLRTITILTLRIVPLLALVSACGLYIPMTYGREMPAFVLQGIAQDGFDLFFILSGMVIAAIAILRGKPAGYVLGPVLVAFAAIMALSLAAMVLVMRLKGAEAEWGLIAGFCGLAIVSAGVFGAFVKQKKGA